jgi:hypothetical protein
MNGLLFASASIGTPSRRPPRPASTRGRSRPRPSSRPPQRRHVPEGGRRGRTASPTRRSQRTGCSPARLRSRPRTSGPPAPRTTAATGRPPRTPSAGPPRRVRPARRASRRRRTGAGRRAGSRPRRSGNATLSVSIVHLTRFGDGLGGVGRPRAADRGSRATGFSPRNAPEVPRPSNALHLSAWFQADLPLLRWSWERIGLSQQIGLPRE